jgi:hypothetical protein
VRKYIMGISNQPGIVAILKMGGWLTYNVQLPKNKMKACHLMGTVALSEPVAIKSLVF